MFYISFSFLLLILSHSLLYILNFRSFSIVFLILYGISFGFPFQQLVINSSLDFIAKISYILLINKINFSVIPSLYYFLFSNIKRITPNGTEIIIFLFNFMYNNKLFI